MRVYVRLFIRIYLCVSLFWMSVQVLGYIITHCMSICISGSYLFLSFSLNICRGDRLYYHSLYVYRSVSWFVFLSLFLFQCLYCHWLQLYRYFSWSVFIILFFFFFFFGQCFYPCMPILSLLGRVKVRLLIRGSLCFSPLCLPVSGYTIGNFMYVKKFIQLTQRVIALYIFIFFYIYFLCFILRIRLLVRFFPLLCLSVNVGNSVRLYYYSLYVHIRLSIVFVCLSFSEYLY